MDQPGGEFHLRGGLIIRRSEVGGRPLPSDLRPPTFASLVQQIGLREGKKGSLGQRTEVGSQRPGRSQTSDFRPPSSDRWRALRQAVSGKRLALPASRLAPCALRLAPPLRAMRPATLPAAPPVAQSAANS